MLSIWTRLTFSSVIDGQAIKVWFPVQGSSCNMFMPQIFEKENQDVESAGVAFVKEANMRNR